MLQGINPPVWRRILTCKDSTIVNLHYVLVKYRSNVRLEILSFHGRPPNFPQALIRALQESSSKPGVWL